MLQGYWKLSQATARVRTANIGQCWPSGATTQQGYTGRTYLNTPYCLVTAANGNGGTVYLMFNATTPGRAVNAREQDTVALTHNQSFSFTGMARGNEAPRDISFGTGKSYVLGSATTQRIIYTYLEEV
jgi:hypothetical protein